MKRSLRLGSGSPFGSWPRSAAEAASLACGPPQQHLAKQGLR